MLTVPETLIPEFYCRELEQRPCRPITLDDTPAIPDLVQKMAQFCRSHNGVGLSAPQVGIFVQLAISMARFSYVDVFINPRIVNLAGRDLLETEGCLSLPPPQEATAKVWRSEIVHVASGTLEDPFANEISILKGYEARVAQHEIDHLNPDGGVFFISRIGSVSRQIVLGKYHKHMAKIERIVKRRQGEEVAAHG